MIWLLNDDETTEQSEVATSTRCILRFWTLPTAFTLSILGHRRNPSRYRASQTIARHPCPVRCEIQQTPDKDPDLASPSHIRFQSLVAAANSNTLRQRRAARPAKASQKGAGSRLRKRRARERATATSLPHCFHGSRDSIQTRL